MKLQLAPCLALGVVAQSLAALTPPRPPPEHRLAPQRDGAAQASGPPARSLQPRCSARPRPCVAFWPPGTVSAVAACSLAHGAPLVDPARNIMRRRQNRITNCGKYTQMCGLPTRAHSRALAPAPSERHCAVRTSPLGIWHSAWSLAVRTHRRAARKARRVAELSTLDSSTGHHSTARRWRGSPMHTACRLKKICPVQTMASAAPFLRIRVKWCVGMTLRVQ